jgi:hypothetical protein
MQRETDPINREFGTVVALSALGRDAEADQALAVFIQDHSGVWPRRCLPPPAIRRFVANEPGLGYQFLDPD